MSLASEKETQKTLKRGIVLMEEQFYYAFYPDNYYSISSDLDICKGQLRCMSAYVAIDQQVCQR